MSRIADDFLERRPELLVQDQSSDAWRRWASRIAKPLEYYFRFRVSGLDKVPPGPCVIVANHGAGAPFVIPLLHRAWWRQWGTRPVRGLVHRLVWQRPMCWFPLLPKLGGVLAHPRVAAAMLERGEAVFAFPGGDLEAMRPFWERSRVSFGGRSGFVRLARQQGVPIVPLAISGSHLVYLLLPGTTALARCFGLPRFLGLKAFPLTVGLVMVVVAAATTLVVPALWPVVLAASVVALLPLPSRIEGKVLEPLVVPPDMTDAAFAEHIEGLMTEAIAG